MTGPPGHAPRATRHVDLPALAPLPTAAERAADLIRDHIFNGEFQPGTQLPETTLAQALQVSRNTVRDAFRMLMNEQLLSYEPHRGVSVKSLSAADIRDIYELRRLIELSAVDAIDHQKDGIDLGTLQETVVAGEQAAEAGNWLAVGTDNLRFHACLVAIHGSPRIDAFFRRLMTELRLGFLMIPDPQIMHLPYLPQNRAIFEQLAEGDLDGARKSLDRYLHEAEHQIVTAIGES